MKYKVEISLLISGLFLFFLSTSDFLSYMAELLNTLFFNSLPIVFFSSYLFRTIILFCGASFIFAGAFYTNTAMNNSLR